MSIKLCDIFVGSETGLLKGVDTRKGNWNNLNSLNVVDKQKEIVALCWGNSEETKLCAGLRDQTVVVFSDGVPQKTFNFEKSEGSLKGLELIDGDFLTCTKSGNLCCWSEDGELKMEKSVGENVYCMRSNPHQRNLVATGGKENELKIWDIEKSENTLFSAKNVRHDWLNVRVPVWILDLGFIPDSQKVVTSTSYHQVRLYDCNMKQRRPVVDMTFNEAPITALSVRSNGHQVLVGNTHGQVALLDVRGRGHLVQKFKGCKGSIKSVKSIDSLNIVVSCGLDRNLRIHDIKTKNLLHTFYMKSRLNCLLVREERLQEEVTDESMKTGEETIRDDHEEDDDDDDDVTWLNSHVLNRKTLSPPDSKKTFNKKRKPKNK